VLAMAAKGVTSRSRHGPLKLGCIGIRRFASFPVPGECSPVDHGGDLMVLEPHRNANPAIGALDGFVLGLTRGMAQPVPFDRSAASESGRHKRGIDRTTSRYHRVAALPISRAGSNHCSDWLGFRAKPTRPDRSWFVAAWLKGHVGWRGPSCFSPDRGGGPYGDSTGCRNKVQQFVSTL